MSIRSNEYVLKSLIASQQWWKEMMNETFVKDWEQNTGFCFIPDAKFPRDICFGLRFLMKCCSLMPWCFGRCFTGAVPLCKGSKNWEIGELEVFNSCSSLWRWHVCAHTVPALGLSQLSGATVPSIVLLLLECLLMALNPLGSTLWDPLSTLAGRERKSFLIQVLLLPPPFI